MRAFEGRVAQAAGVANAADAVLVALTAEALREGLWEVWGIWPTRASCTRTVGHVEGPTRRRAYPSVMDTAVEPSVGRLEASVAAMRPATATITA